MKIFGKTLKEYLWPIRYYILGSVLVVLSQYIVFGGRGDQYPILIRLTQIFWELMVALSVMKLVKKHDFNMKNVIVLGVLYSFIIHGLKISVRYFFYDRTFWYLLGRFIYGSFLVMLVTIPLGAIFIYSRKHPWKITTKKDIIYAIIAIAISLLIVWLIAKGPLIERVYKLLTLNR